MEEQAELTKRAAAFLACFELVFDNDWWFTKVTIRDDAESTVPFIAENGTFLNPFPGEHFTGGKGDNWGNRSCLLDSYRELRAYIISEGLYTDFRNY
jgi:hypothetical protein